MDDIIELPEVEVRPIGLTLQTFYPITSEQYPLTGHSQLKVVKKENNIGGPGFTMSLGFDNKGYNLITNNCSDYTRKGLEAITGKKLNPWFFTTPGDVQDFFINNFNVVKKPSWPGSDTYWTTISENEYEKLQNVYNEQKKLDMDESIAKLRKRRIKAGHPLPSDLK